MLPTISANNRPNAPDTWVRTRASVSLVWHHILPFYQLRDVWNALVTQCHESQLDEARTALRQYLLMCDKNLRDLDVWINRIRANNLSLPDCNHFAGKAVWPAWNVVEGPDSRFRTDDPGDRFIDRYTHGLTLEEHGRMKSIESLYHQLLALDLSRDLTAPELRSLAANFNIARRTLVSDRPTPFRESMWVRGAAGMWTKRRSGEQFIVEN